MANKSPEPGGDPGLSNLMYISPKVKHFYRKPEVCHRIIRPCAILGVTSTWGYCGMSPQGRRRGNQYSVAIIYAAPPFFVVWDRPDLNRRPAEWITPFSATVSGSFVSIALPLSYCPMVPGTRRALSFSQKVNWQLTFLDWCLTKP